MRDCWLPNKGLWILNIWDSFYSKMKKWLVTKDPKRDYSIVNNFFRRFKVNCYNVVSSNEKTCDRDCLVYQIFFILVKN
jgi:hypothetical protein